MVLDKKKIEKEAKQILDKFVSALLKVEREDEEGYIDRDVFERAEDSGKECEKDFKKKILKNAPESNDDFIIVERGGWK